MEWAHMAYFMVFARRYWEVGGLDESYWLYGEDLDFCLRLGELGASVWWLADSGAIHSWGHSAKTVGADPVLRFAATFIRILTERSKYVSAMLFRLGMAAKHLANALGRDRTRPERFRRLRLAGRTLRLPVTRLRLRQTTEARWL